MTEEKANSPYGYCPICRARGVNRERRPYGDDICEKGHIYPSENAVYYKAERVPVAWRFWIDDDEWLKPYWTAWTADEGFLKLMQQRGFAKVQYAYPESE